MTLCLISLPLQSSTVTLNCISEIITLNYSNIHNSLQKGKTKLEKGNVDQEREISMNQDTCVKSNLIPGSISSFHFPSQNFKAVWGENFFNAFVILSSRTTYVNNNSLSRKRIPVTWIKDIKVTAFFHNKNWSVKALSTCGLGQSLLTI